MSETCSQCRGTGRVTFWEPIPAEPWRSQPADDKPCPACSGVPVCPTCGGDDLEGGTVAVAGPDDCGQYDTEDCPDDFHRGVMSPVPPGDTA